MSCLDTANDCWIASNLKRSSPELKVRKTECLKDREAEQKKYAPRCMIFQAMAFTRGSDRHQQIICSTSTSKTMTKGRQTQSERSLWLSQAHAASRLHGADERSRSQRLNTAQVHARWIMNKMSYWLIDLYARHSGFPPPTDSPFQFQSQ